MLSTTVPTETLGSDANQDPRPPVPPSVNPTETPRRRFFAIWSLLGLSAALLVFATATRSLGVYYASFGAWALSHFADRWGERR